MSVVKPNSYFFSATFFTNSFDSLIGVDLLGGACSLGDGEVGCDGLQTIFGLLSIGHLCRVGDDEYVWKHDVRSLLYSVVYRCFLLQLFWIEASVAVDEVIEVESHA